MRRNNWPQEPREQRRLAYLLVGIGMLLLFFGMVDVLSDQFHWWTLGDFLCAFTAIALAVACIHARPPDPHG